MMSADLDLDLYLKLIGAEGKAKVGDPPSLALLKTIVSHNVISLPYQNYDLLVNRKIHDFTPSFLFEKIVVKKRGGICIESCELMLVILRQFNFDARRLPTFVLVNGCAFDENSLYDHNVIVVYLNDKMYLVDMAFSYYSPREPLEFNFNESQEIFVRRNEKFRLTCFPDHYIMSMSLGTSWMSMYRFPRPLQFQNTEDCMKNYDQIANSSSSVLIRDSLLKMSILTPHGRVGFTCLFESKTLDGNPPYHMIYSENDGVPTYKEVTYETFRDNIKKYLNIEINDDYFYLD